MVTLALKSSRLTDNDLDLWWMLENLIPKAHIFAKTIPISADLAFLTVLFRVNSGDTHISGFYIKVGDTLLADIYGRILLMPTIAGYLNGVMEVSKSIIDAKQQATPSDGLNADEPETELIAGCGLFLRCSGHLPIIVGYIDIANLSSQHTV